MADETTPLLNDNDVLDPHAQFCLLIGVPPFDEPDRHHPASSSRTLYNRANRKRRSQSMTYSFTAALSNTLLLSQVVLGATLTALGASESSHVLITIFGVLNTIIAGLVAYLKSRGQPMRARMFRDDLEHVVDEIENSKTMWLGIKSGIHGYDEIDIDDKVSVRSEVARLTRLYESAVKKYMQNNPDMYSMGGGMLDAITGLRARPGAGVQLPPAATAPSAGGGAAPAAAPMAALAPVGEADESPATAKDAVVKADKSDEDGSATSDGKDTEAVKGGEESSVTGKDGVKADDKGKEKDEETDAAAHSDEPTVAKNEDADVTEGAASEDKQKDASRAKPASAAPPSQKDDDPRVIKQ